MSAILLTEPRGSCERRGWFYFCNVNEIAASSQDTMPIPSSLLLPCTVSKHDFLPGDNTRDSEFSAVKVVNPVD
jgi:hypothetical protein